MFSQIYLHHKTKRGGGACQISTLHHNVRNMNNLILISNNIRVFLNEPHLIIHDFVQNSETIFSSRSNSVKPRFTDIPVYE